jgi:hypothetical protein
MVGGLIYVHSASSTGRSLPSLTHAVCSQAAEALTARGEAEGFGHWAYGGAPQSSRWREGWPGLGSAEPAAVPGLHGVQSVALGSFHALAHVA